jgi:hypothetical protein
MTREQTLGNHIADDHRVQYDDKDGDRIEGVASLLTQAAMLQLDALAKYRDSLAAPVDENAADATKQARYDVIYAWTMVQTAASKIAWALRFDGEEAFNRAIETMSNDLEDFPKLSDL